MKSLIFVLTILSATGLYGQKIYFPPLIGDYWESISPDSLNYCEENISELYDFLDSSQTKAFILLKDGKIVLEKYFGDHDISSQWYWASAVKTLTAFMVGIAQQEGHLNISDKTSEYLGSAWTSCAPEQEDRITVWHQLTMTSGLDDSVQDSHCTLDTCLRYKADAGTRWAYHNAPYTLLDEVISNATGTNLNLYINQKLKSKTGITGLFVKLGYNNVFFSTARIMARFGLLILNKGVWNEVEIMSDTAYFNQMTTMSQSLNEAYGFLWWLNGSNTFMVPGFQFRFPGSMSPDAPGDMISALGKNGQILNVVPDQNLVWLRMGESPDSSDSAFFLNNDIWKYVNELECPSSLVPQSIDIDNDISIFPNPASDRLSIHSDKAIKKLDILTLEGKLISSCTQNCSEIDISDIINGMYILKTSFQDGSSRYFKFFKK